MSFGGEERVAHSAVTRKSRRLLRYGGKRRDHFPRLVARTRSVSPLNVSRSTGFVRKEDLVDRWGNLFGEVAAGPNRPTQCVGQSKQRLVARTSVRIRRQVATGCPHCASQDPTVVEVPVRPSTVQYEHSHGWVDDSEQFDETSLTSRFFVSTSSVGRTDRCRHNREAHHRCQDLATPSISFRREVQTLTTNRKHRAERTGHRAKIARRHLDHRQSAPTVRPDALVNEPMRHRHLITSSPAAAAAASACWPGMT